MHAASGWCAMFAGCAIYSFGASVFLVPNSIVTGGLTGLATLIHILWERIPVGICSIVLNIPVLILGFIFAGKKCTFKFIPTVIFLGVTTDLFSLVPPVTDDMIMAAVTGHVCPVDRFRRHTCRGGCERRRPPVADDFTLCR